MTVVRVLADDLTGALDAGARFVATTGALGVAWCPDAPDARAGSYALDTETRTSSWESARPVLAASAAMLRGGDIAFKKIDSLLRGNTLREIALCATAGGFATTVVAPAFPAQGRITRAGRQLVRDGASWRPAGPELAGALAELGLPARNARSGERILAAGAHVFDAETEDDLAAIASAPFQAPVLWCGSAGLAGALGGGAGACDRAMLRPPALVIIGSDDPVAASQASRLRGLDPALVEPLSAERCTNGPALRRAARRLEDGRSAALVPPMAALDRGEAASLYAAVLSRLTVAVPRPGALIVVGGETLMRACRALGIASLTVHGELMPGVPVSRAVGGAWDGLAIVSKAGAFGGPGAIADILAMIDGGGATGTCSGVRRE